MTTYYLGKMLASEMGRTSRLPTTEVFKRDGNKGSRVVRMHGPVGKRDTLISHGEANSVTLPPLVNAVIG